MNNPLVPSEGSIVPKERSDDNLSKNYIELVRPIVTGYKDQPSYLAIDIFFRHMCELDLDFLAGTPLAKYVEMVMGEKFEPFHDEQIGEGIIQLKGKSYVPYDFENEVVGHALKLRSRGIDPAHFIEKVMELDKDGKWVRERGECMCYSRNLESIAEIALNGASMEEYTRNIQEFEKSELRAVGPAIAKIMANNGDVDGFVKTLAHRGYSVDELYFYVPLLAPFFYNKTEGTKDLAAPKKESREVGITRDDAIRIILNIRPTRTIDPDAGVYLKEVWKRGLDINKRVNVIGLLNSMGHQFDSYDSFDVKLHLNSLECGFEGDLRLILSSIYSCNYQFPTETSGMDIKINGRKSRSKLARFANDFYSMVTVASRDFGRAAGYEKAKD